MSQTFALACIGPERSSYFNTAGGLKFLSDLVGSSGVPGRVAQMDTSGYMRNQLPVPSWPS